MNVGQDTAPLSVEVAQLAEEGTEEHGGIGRSSRYMYIYCTDALRTDPV